MPSWFRDSTSPPSEAPRPDRPASGLLWPGSQTRAIRGPIGSDTSAWKARAAAGRALQIYRPSTLPSGLSQGPALLSSQALSPARKIIAARTPRVTCPGPWRRSSTVTWRSSLPFPDRYASGTLHPRYLLNSHSGHTKKLLFPVDETETPFSGTCPEPRTLQRQDWALEPALCESAAPGFPGQRLQASAGPGRPRAQMTPAGIRAAPRRSRTSAKGWFRAPLPQRPASLG